MSKAVAGGENAIHVRKRDDALNISGGRSDRGVHFIFLSENHLDAELQGMFAERFGRVIPEAVSGIGLVVGLKRRIPRESVAAIGGIGTSDYDTGDFVPEARSRGGRREGLGTREKTTNRQIGRPHKRCAGPVYIGKSDVIGGVTEDQIVNECS